MDDPQRKLSMSLGSQEFVIDVKASEKENAGAGHTPNKISINEDSSLERSN